MQTFNYCNVLTNYNVRCNFFNRTLSNNCTPQVEIEPYG